MINYIKIIYFRELFKNSKKYITSKMHKYVNIYSSLKMIHNGSKHVGENILQVKLYIVLEGNIVNEGNMDKWPLRNAVICVTTDDVVALGNVCL
jgi:hypothetical protein